MEAHKERREQVEKDERDGKMIKDHDNKETGLDPMAKNIIRESVITTTTTTTTSRGEDNNKEEVVGAANDPDDLLVFFRSVHKIDSSLE
ncbi:hypothetical protein HS088_TW13G00715 [Tripterygium wilfordii]|uniref:Uncharacterized protein n=1 Tax=Tripterygium wilfordii TaxID=458696 RepID=A0A7J7CUX0_TRIWF|nr:hypothetical protein HS088_TW13G00715 [Tripterygium wilfordii]